MELGSHDPWAYEVESESQDEDEPVAVEGVEDGVNNPHNTGNQDTRVQAKHWVFTVHGEVARIGLPDPATFTSQCTYMLYQREIAPTTGALHLQGFVSFKKQARRSDIFREFGCRCWCAPVKKMPQAMAYCKKPETRDPGTEPFEWGEAPKGMGERTDIEAFKADIDTGATDEKLWDDHASITLRSYRAFPFLRACKPKYPLREDAPRLICLLGPAGSGKTTYLRAKASKYMTLDGFTNPTPYAKHLSEWWDHYDGYSDVHFEDMSGNYFRAANEFTTLVSAARPYLKSHGALDIRMNAKRIWFCSNTMPSEWWPNARTVDPGAITRRFHVIGYMAVHWMKPRWFVTDEEDTAWAKFRASIYYLQMIENFEASQEGNREAYPDRVNARSRFLS